MGAFSVTRVKFNSWLLLSHPLLVFVGWFWIDPNLGAPNDAIQVWCNLTAHGETCVYPNRKKRMVTPKFWEKKKSNDEETWFSDMYGGFEVSQNFVL